MNHQPSQTAALSRESSLAPLAPDALAREPGVAPLASKAAVIALLAMATVLVWTAAPALAQGPREDLTALSLEELMDLDVLFVNVLGTHTHLAGEWMIGYRFMFMKMDGNRDGTERIDSGEVLQQFMVAPESMNMSMHMLEVMYAPSDDLTFMIMLPQLQLSMDHVTRMGVRFTTESQGLGDISVSALYTVYGDVRTDHHRILFIPGVSLPTGSINERDDTPAGKNMKLPYPMQLGSGTFDLMPAVAYLGESENWAWMGHARGTIRLGKNDNQYSLGDQLRLSAWISRRLAHEASVSAQIEGHFWGNIDGADPALNPMMVPTANPKLRAGKRIDLFLALNLYAPSGKLEGNRLAVEGGFPLYQSLDGPQLETDWQGKLVWNWTF